MKYVAPFFVALAGLAIVAVIATWRSPTQLLRDAAIVVIYFLVGMAIYFVRGQMLVNNRK